MIRRGPRFWFLNCCISPQSEIARIRIDSSMIGGPTNFRHIGHMGASDLNATFNVDAISCLLRSKGDDSYSLPVPQHLRANDVPIRGLKIRKYSVIEKLVERVQVPNGYQMKK
ncbi:hypothetical protein WUBG_08915 [Wuchereria bancrofti]|uniref:CRIB domain-containing protein n=1 Tax=Wuchereria bancrofti TaxID=6293 RepID=J9ECL2_WUCBA|nr:hypothetical protein WUBG_08915 [Wuchereria bancrofti]VDM12137.1 unnamed protein product [Wuchereria bancrofti]